MIVCKLAGGTVYIDEEKQTYRIVFNDNTPEEKGKAVMFGATKWGILGGAYLIDTSSCKTEVEKIDVNDKIPIIDKIVLDIDKNVFKPVHNFTKKVESTTKQIALIGILGVLAFLYLTAKK